MSKEISNGEDILYSLDIIGRLEELENEDRDDDEQAEYEALTSLAEEASGYAPDWRYGETLIRESYFEDYARELAYDIGAIDPDAGWPTYCIDWEQAARELLVDYTGVDFDGVTYYIR
jgi:antirestriction protein